MNYKKFFTELFLFIILIISLLPQVKYHGSDMNYWVCWTRDIFSHGLGNAYDYGVDYPPFFLYFLKLFGWIQGSIKDIEKNIAFVRYISFFFDLLPLAILAIYRKSDIKNNIHYFLLFNIAYFYNTLMWGQVDGIHSSLILISLFLALKNPLASSLIFLVALNVKLQSIIFFPILGILLIMKIKSIKNLLTIIVSCIALEIVILLPFILTNKVASIWNVVVTSVGHYPVLSMNAFNFWHLLRLGNPFEISDTLTGFLGITYKKWGLILFCLFSAITLFPLFLQMLKTLVSKKLPFHIQEILFLSAGLIAVIFFFFNTEMHERYSHPAMILFFFYGIYRRKFGLFAIVSVAYFLNMEKVLEYFSMSHGTLIYNRSFIAGLFAIVLIWGIVKLYRIISIKNDILYIANNIRKTNRKNEL